MYINRLTYVGVKREEWFLTIFRTLRWGSKWTPDVCQEPFPGGKVRKKGKSGTCRRGHQKKGKWENELL